jgi:hypothetical protein
MGPAAEPYRETLDRMLDEYRRLPQTQDVRRLVEMDRELDAVVEKIRTAHGRDSARFWRKDYEAIGLYVGYYSEALGYSGKLLVEAHRRNPNSPYRGYTLFTTIVGERTAHGLGVMPNLDQAYTYLEEFPDGPYAEHTYEILGFFYDDLFKVLKGLVGNADERDYKYDCFAPYITNGPYDAQMRSAGSAAIRHLKTAIGLNPRSERNEYRHEVLRSIQSGHSQEWHWCAD